MFSPMALAPLLMGFDPNVSILFSGSATLMIRSWAGRCRAISVQALRSLVPCSPQQARSRAALGLVLAPVAIDSASGVAPDETAGTSLARWIALTTVLAVGVVAVNAVGTTGNRARFRRQTNLLVLFRDDHPGYSTY